MRIIDCIQRSEEWDKLRCRPTASGFSGFITPAKGDYAAAATTYAAKIVAKKLGVYTEAPPSWAMERGTELEPSAKLAYEKLTGRKITDVGFIMPDGNDAYGGSPDGLVGEDGVFEAKCPLAETLIGYHVNGGLPVQYKPQCQGLLLISGRPWLDFFGFHPELPLFLFRVEADLKYQQKIAEGLLLLLEEIKEIESRVSKETHQLVDVESRDNMKWEGSENE